MISIDAEEASQRQEFARSAGAVQLFAPVRLIHISNYTSGATDKLFTNAIATMVEKKTDVAILDDEGVPPKTWKFLKSELVKHQEFEYSFDTFWMRFNSFGSEHSSSKKTKAFLELSLWR